MGSKSKRSAGLLLYRLDADCLEVLLAHPGGPFWRRRDLGAWSIPKGAIEPGEDAETAARREFAEETGHAPQGPALSLGEARQPSGKIIEAFALAGDWDPQKLVSNSFEMRWPPRSTHLVAFPEIDRAAWFALPEARERILKGQAVFLARLTARLAPP